jgi:hypothetical protein
MRGLAIQIAYSHEADSLAFGNSILGQRNAVIYAAKSKLASFN